MSRLRVGGATVASLAAIAMLASACSSSGSTAKKVTHVSASANQVNAQPRSALKQGGTMTWPIGQFPEQYNYNQVNGPQVDTWSILGALMPQPFHATAGGTPYVNTDYMTSVTESMVNGKETVTYDINPKAKWSTGAPITWQDFYWQWKALNGKNSAYQVASSTGYQNIGNVAEGKNAQEAVVTYAQPFVDWKSIFSPLYPAATDKSVSVFNNGWTKGVLVSSGPFKLQSINQTTKTVTLVRDPNWWGQPAMLDKIVFPTLDDNAMASAYDNGDIDFFTITDASDYKRAASAKNNAYRVAGGPDYRLMEINGQSPMLKDVRVRQAFSEALNRSDIVKADVSGLPWPDTTLGNHYFMNNQTGYQDDSNPVGTFSDANASKLLDEAGWKMGTGGYRTKDGKTLTLRYVIVSGLQEDVNEAQIVTQMEKAVGIKVQTVTVPADDLFTKYLMPGNYDASTFSFYGTPFPISSNYSLYQNPQGSNIFQNFGRIGSKAIDDLMNQAMSATDPQQAIKLSNEIDKKLWQEVDLIPLYQKPQIYAQRSDLANYGSFGFADIIYQNIGFMKNPPAASK